MDLDFKLSQCMDLGLAARDASISDPAFCTLQVSGENLNGLTFSEDLFSAMRLSQHPPHLAEPAGFDGRTASPTFLFFWYDRETKENSGVPAGPYGER